jgi:hypothetical protein
VSGGNRVCWLCKQADKPALVQWAPRVRLSPAAKGANLLVVRSVKERNKMDAQDNPVAIVTGAASGIGLATALAFAKASYRVFLVDCNEAQLGRIAREDFSSFGVGSYCGDVSAPAQVRAVAGADRRHRVGVGLRHLLPGQIVAGRCGARERVRLGDQPVQRVVGERGRVLVAVQDGQQKYFRLATFTPPRSVAVPRPLKARLITGLVKVPHASAM